MPNWRNGFELESGIEGQVETFGVKMVDGLILKGAFIQSKYFGCQTASYCPLDSGGHFFILRPSELDASRGL